MMRTAVLLALCYGAVVHGEGDLNGVAFSGANVETGNRPVQMLQCQLENLKDAGVPDSDLGDLKTLVANGKNASGVWAACPEVTGRANKCHLCGPNGNAGSCLEVTELMCKGSDRKACEDTSKSIACAERKDSRDENKCKMIDHFTIDGKDTQKFSARCVHDLCSPRKGHRKECNNQYGSLEYHWRLDNKIDGVKTESERIKPGSDNRGIEFTWDPNNYKRAHEKNGFKQYVAVGLSEECPKNSYSESMCGKMGDDVHYGVYISKCGRKKEHCSGGYYINPIDPSMNLCGGFYSSDQLDDRWEHCGADEGGPWPKGQARLLSDKKPNPAYERRFCGRIFEGDRVAIILNNHNVLNGLETHDFEIYVNGILRYRNKVFVGRKKLEEKIKQNEGSSSKGAPRREYSLYPSVTFYHRDSKITETYFIKSSQATFENNKIGPSLAYKGALKGSDSSMTTIQEGIENYRYVKDNKCSLFTKLKQSRRRRRRRLKQTATCKPLYLDLNVPEKTHSVLIKSGKDPQGEGDNFWEKYSKTSDGRTLKTKDITFQFKPVGGEGTVEGLALKPDPNSLFGFVASFTCKDNAKQLCCPEKNKAFEFLVHVGIKAPEVKAGGDVAVFHVKVETDEKGRPSFDWEDCKGKLTESGCLETRRRRLLVAAGARRRPMC